MTDETTDTGLTIDQIQEKYTDPRFDLLRSGEYMTEQHWGIFEMFLIEVMVNAVTTCDLKVVAQLWPDALPPLALDVCLDILRSEQSVRHYLTGGELF